MMNRMVSRSKWLVAMSTGTLTLGILQSLSLVNFAEVFTTFLTQWLAIFVTALFGGDVSQYTDLL